MIHTDGTPTIANGAGDELVRDRFVTDTERVLDILGPEARDVVETHQGLEAALGKTPAQEPESRPYHEYRLSGDEERGWTLTINGWGCGHTFKQRAWAESALRSLNDAIALDYCSR